MSSYSRSFRNVYTGYVLGTSDGVNSPLVVNNTTCDSLRARSGTSNPGWRQQVRNAQNATTPLNASASVVDVFNSQASFKIRKTVGNQVNTISKIVTGRCFAPVSIAVPSASPTSATNEALRYLHRHIRQTRTQMHGMTFLGELRQAVGMLRSRSRALFDGIGGYTSTALRIARRTPRNQVQRNLSNAWLEWSFGWAPLINDLKDAAIAIARLQHDLERREVCRGVGRSEDLIQLLPESFFYSTSNLFCKALKRTTDEVLVIHRAGQRYAAGNPTLGSPEHLVGLLGFTFEEFVPTLWELTPYSWLVDYFTNAGEIISAYSTDTSNTTWTCRSIVIKRVVRYNVQVDWATTLAPFTSSGWTVETFSGGNLGGYRSEGRTVVRDLQPVSVPDWQWTAPAESSLRWLNLSALLAGRSASPNLNRG